MITIRKKTLKLAIVAPILLWALVSLYLFTFKNDFIFDFGGHEGKKASVEFQTHAKKSSEGHDVELWYRTHDTSRQIILYLHGASGRDAERFSNLSQYANVLSPAYPGFGGSSGEPSSENIYETVDLSIGLARELGYADENIIVWGMSLGGAPATYAAVQYPEVSQVVLVNTFDSIRQMGFRRYGPFAFFAWGILDSEALAPLTKAPIRQFHVVDDKTVPVDAGINLYLNLGSQDKQFTILEGDHMQFDLYRTLKDALKYHDTKKHP